MQNLTVIVNEGSGTGSSPSPQEVADAFRRAGIEIDLRLTSAEDPAGAARAAVAGGAVVVVAGGGDGTVSAVAGVLAGTPVALGVLPLGTLNHFAKDLGLPQTLDAAVALIAAALQATPPDAATTRVDVGEVNDLVFVNNSSIGFYPRVVKRRDHIRYRFGHGKWRSMLTAVVNVFRRFPVVDVRVDAAGDVVHRSTPFVFVGNNPYELGGLAMGERLSLVQGQLCLFMAHRPGRWGLIVLLLRALFGRLNQAKDFDSLCVTEAVVNLRRRRVAVAADGEVTWMSPPLRYRIRPADLRVIAPVSPSILPPPEREPG